MAQRLFYSLFLSTLGLIIFAFSTNPPKLAGSDTVEVTRNIAAVDAVEEIHIVSAADGDTLHILRKNGEKATLRLIGIDTPETVDPRKSVQCYGKEASDFTKSLVTDVDAIMTFDSSQQQYDKYNRLLGYISLPDKSDLGEKLLRNGYATEYTYSVPYSKQQIYKKAEGDARAAQIGFWNTQLCNGQR